MAVDAGPSHACPPAASASAPLEGRWSDRGGGNGDEPGDPLAWIQARLRWATTVATNAIRVAVGLLVIALGSLALNVVHWAASDPPRYFAATADGRFIELAPLDEPIQSEAQVKQWVADRVRETLSIDFVDWRAQLNAQQPYYEPRAFKSLIESMQEHGGMLDLVREQKLVTHVDVRQAPVVQATGLDEGRRLWRIGFPLRMSYESQSGTEATQDYEVVVTVARVPVTELADGLRIRQIVPEPASLSGP